MSDTKVQNKTWWVHLRVVRARTFVRAPEEELECPHENKRARLRSAASVQQSINHREVSAHLKEADGHHFCRRGLVRKSFRGLQRALAL